MKRKTVTLIIVLAALVLLSGGYFAAQAWSKAHPKASPYASAPARDTPRLTEFDSGKIVKLDLVSSGFSLEKNGDNWELANAPTGIRIDQSAVSGKLWYAGSVWAESVVDDAPGDLSQYGLAEPQGHAIVADSEGKRAELFFGNLNPGRSAYYTMVSGDPKVYTVSSYSADSLLFSLDSIRDRSIYTGFDPATVIRFTLDNGRTLIDIVPRPEDVYLVSNFSQFMLISPYKARRGVDSQKFSEILEPLQALQINQFVEDNPASLAPYGLDKPGKLHIEAGNGVFDLLFGRSGEGELFAKLPDKNGVFTVANLDAVVGTTAFNLADKFSLIFNIDIVDYFTVSGEGRTLRADIKGTKDEAEFSLNGKKTLDKEFRTYYQAVIGLLVDAEYPGPLGEPAAGSPVTIEFNLKEPQNARVSVTLRPYNRDYYALTQDGNTEFVVSRSQVRNIFETADKMAYAE
ncbi:DUF4340 domain-containing protein [Leadbettera azotonutricia]|uniref:DUF4340 domain-containing protein n=1 Tax=Leadbettera azotonutricia (strain ATCC BAA-888 / DSM 13862 / ZAS-9) TaxID=545695 RepID=F5YD62_LEAAZ|nr:DUF4340 domain-containing protein [Leadbettera azotonutricia]AEF83197.1 hypothetical protein TREAZ_2751 [Leadbettera azotonutricia ZAS-9]